MAAAGVENRWAEVDADPCSGCEEEADDGGLPMWARSADSALSAS